MRFTNGGIRAILVSCIIISFVASPVSGCAEIFTWTRTSNTQFDSNIKIINAGEDLYATNGEEMMQYNNDEWKRIDTSVHPEVRMHFSISYDQKNEQILLFGGWDDSSESVFNDLWSFDVKTKIWSEITNSNAPQGVQDGYMTFIPNLNKTILFSGTNDLGSQNYFQLFDYSTSTWDHIAPDSYIPVPRWGHSLVHIESMGMLYLIGGGSWGVSEWDYRNDVHVYNFTSNQWTLLIYNGDSKISPRARFATQYDPIHNVILVHGGMNDSNIFDDTWTYDILENEWNELELENILFGSGHSIALMNNTFHLVEKYHYILDDLSLDTLYSKNDNRTDQISDYDREACLQTNFFIELFGLTGFPPLYLVAIIGTPIILTLWIWIVRRSKAKERQ